MPSALLHSIGSWNAALRCPCRLQQFHDLSVTPTARMLQRRCALGIPRLDCGAVIQQLANGRDVACCGGLMQSKVHCIAEGKKEMQRAARKSKADKRSFNMPYPVGVSPQNPIRELGFGKSNIRAPTACENENSFRILRGIAGSRRFSPALAASAASPCLRLGQWAG